MPWQAVWELICSYSNIRALGRGVSVCNACRAKEGGFHYHVSLTWILSIESDKAGAEYEEGKLQSQSYSTTSVGTARLRPTHTKQPPR